MNYGKDAYRFIGYLSDYLDDDRLPDMHVEVKVVRSIPSDSDGETWSVHHIALAVLHGSFSTFRYFRSRNWSSIIPAFP
ncbi:uncharacterized protein PHACADRAFT_259642 [Phanerochaete carnosa HHB-10118-sp]|uniref:Uncharacterized protein n=1 Tax=Phanerochaete carnosa (strain HHB-10118-sp) TaxID=650164 RepID=K5W360_PHACS|nr:uncharacterized protein PHACADRAFT_259642 [Phanerochaete carnosa HHB-10118-sp]EKM53339.1 hypothetical protein PHACADRAFT_259642 [Phanerochaete carnosa HHB-10118-sp]